MKPYGNSRRDNLGCGHGCCFTKYMKCNTNRSSFRAMKRGRRKARQQARKVCNQAD